MIETVKLGVKEQPDKTFHAQNADISAIPDVEELQEG
jgi:hypothetical protein